MKKVLILSYYWPPAGGAGVQRWLKFVKYMRLYGYEPIVYTALNGEMPVTDESLLKDVPEGITVLRRPIWEPYTFYKLFIGRKKEDRINASFLSEKKKPGLTEKVSVWLRGNFFIPDARRFWIRPSTNYLGKWLRANPVSFIISTGPPHSMHLIAMNLKARFPQIKWLADFRDPWTNIDFYEKLMLSKAADARHRRLELAVLNKADCVVSVGHHMSGQLEEIYRAAGGKVKGKFHVIPNGFDTEDLVQGEAGSDTKFSIAHIGTLVKDRNPAVLWRVLGRLVAEDPTFAAQLEIKLVGKVDIFVKEQIESNKLSAYVRRIDYMPHAEVIREQQRSRVLLLLINNTPNARGIVTGKLFEYLASGPPVVAIGPADGDVAQILEETGAGMISGFDDDENLRKNILACFKGVTMKRNADKINRYSRKNLTERLCKLLGSLEA